MANYNLRIKRDAEKDILALTKPDRKRIVERIHQLSANPRPNGVEKLKGDDGYRIRQGDYRIIYLINDKEKSVHIVKVGHRREVYR